MASRSIIRAQIPLRPYGSDKCLHHRQKELVYFCETCDELACTDCVFSTHQGHRLDSLENVLSRKRDQIQNYVRETEQFLLPMYVFDIESIDAKIKKNGDHFCQLISEIQEQGKFLKEEIDQLTEKLVNVCRSIQTENAKILKQYQQELKKINVDMRNQISQCKTVLNQGTNIEVFDIEKDFLTSPSALPAMALLSDAEFKVPSSFNLTEKIESLYGMLTELEDHWSGQTPTHEDESASDLMSSLTISFFQ